MEGNDPIEDRTSAADVKYLVPGYFVSTWDKKLRSISAVQPVCVKTSTHVTRLWAALDHQYDRRTGAPASFVQHNAAQLSNIDNDTAFDMARANLLKSTMLSFIHKDALSLRKTEDAGLTVPLESIADALASFRLAIIGPGEVTLPSSSSGTSDQPPYRDVPFHEQLHAVQLSPGMAPAALDTEPTSRREKRKLKDADEDGRAYGKSLRSSFLVAKPASEK